MKTSYADFSKAKRADLENMAANWYNPMYEHYSNRRDALNSEINLGLGVTLPNAVIRPLTIATVAQKIIPRGFSSAKQFAQAGSELEAALQKSGLKYSNVGVMGSAVTNISSKGGGFRQTAIGTLKASDIDVYVELTQQSGLKANSAGFVHPDKLLKNFPELKSWSDKWSEILGRQITPGGWNPGALKDANIIKF